ncbi:hypothetical protein CPB83DRAFT_843440 [Crepidotus variabilis]|uniref:Uncharacterized protein n=1 Tax=Crepidotus variabilis TaxID=179855 RepID=A0A9P6JV65_9AGAR|nr:hypothetical protein CPB83DRAFT_843440 [Crepidotus variabilis]
MTAPQTASSQVGASGSASVQPSKTNTVTSTQQNRSTKKPQKTAQSPPQVQMLPKAPRTSGEQKVPRRSSKPIINWFQRKLAGTSKAKRTENHPLGATKPNMARQNSASSRHMGRITSSPLPVPAVQQLKQQNGATLPRRKTTRSISLNGDEELNNRQSYGLDDDLSDQSSFNRDSLWSPTSALEADDDASLRPLPPSAPPSPSPSRDSSSYLSDPRTFRSMAASTKPTTLLSIDLNGGMAHIAQVPPSATTPLHRLAPHVRQSSSLSGQGMLNTGTSITFSALPSPQPSSRPSSVRNPGSFSSVTALAPPGHNAVQAPLHTAHHPRNNPRPSSPPMDNASMLTLASSAFASPVRPNLVNYTSSAIGDSVSHYGGSVVFPDGESTSHYVGDDADERLDERDFDASVRALRPRSSRRGSWESEASRWSARVQSPGGTSLARGVWFTNSIRTGGPENGEVYETADEQTPDTATRELDSESSSLTGPIVDVTAATPQDELPIMELMGGIPVEQKNVVESPTAKAEVPELQHRSSTDTISHNPVSSSVSPVDSERAEEPSEAKAQVDKDVVV